MSKHDGTSPSNANRNKHKVLHDYHDHARETFPSDVDNSGGGGGGGEKRKGPRGGVSVPFPVKLHVMLSNAEDRGLSHVVSWQPHGRCFVVHKPKKFVTDVMPVYFRQTKLTSFQRQLNLYGFSRITKGKDRGGYYHELFLKHKLFLCQNMPRIRIKGTGIKGKTSPETEPDFYSMPWVEPGCAAMVLNRDLEGEVTAAMELENKRSGRKEGGSKKRQHTLTSNPKLKHVEANVVNSSPRSTLVDTIASACPSFSSTDPEDANDGKQHCGDEFTFEGKRFHYLERSCFAALASRRSFLLEPRRNATTAQSHNSASLLPPIAKSRPYDRSLLIVRSLRGPILTPSSSTSSLGAMLEQDQTLEINPDTIFSDEFDGDYEVGGVAVDADAEFKTLGE